MDVIAAATVMDIISRLPKCAGQAAHAISAYTQVRMEDASKLHKIPESECPDFWIRLPRHKWRKSWLKTLRSLLNEICTDIHLLASCGKDNSRKFYWNLDGKKVPNWDCLFVHRKQGLFLSVYNDDIKMADRKQNMTPMWKKLMKLVDLGEPTSFLDQVYLGCTQRECKPNETIIDENRKMFESRISGGATENCQWEKSHAKTVAWSYDMEGHEKKCVERCCALANRETEQLYKVSTLCLDDYHFKKEVLESVGELSKVCSQIVLRCLYLAQIGRPDILWSVNKLAQADKKWTRACDRRLARLVAYSHHTNDHYDPESS